jgi:hypothetical protein
MVRSYSSAAVCLLVAAAACSRTDLPPSPTSASELERPTEESLLAAFASEMIPKVAHVVSAEGTHQRPAQVTGPQAWVWTGEVSNGEGESSPFTTRVTVTSLRIEASGAEPASYLGIVSWDCSGTGPYRCFENRYSHEDTRYQYRVDSREWQKVEARRHRR